MRDELKYSSCHHTNGRYVVPVPLYQAKAGFFRTLGHPARIRVLELLAGGDRPVHELLAAITIEPSNLSQQLAVLRMAGLVVQRREGTEVIYSLALPEVRDLLLAARRILETKHATAGDLVDEVSRPPVSPR
jgi:ArsR family transcriptional regulator